MLQISQRLAAVQPSSTIVINTRAGELAAEGADVINFSVGEPDLPTPDTAKEGGAAAIEEDDTRYTPAPGTVELRRAISEKLARFNGLEYPPEQIIATVGAKQALFNAVMALCDPGDEVIVPAPYWVSYPQQVALAGGRTVAVDTRPEDGFKLTPEQLEAALADKTRLLMLNTPVNPTGAVYSDDELAGLWEVLAGSGVVVLADEIYERLVYGGAEHTSFAALSKEARRHTVTISGMSKTYAMTGWRVGYAAGPQQVMDAMVRLQSHSTSNTSSVSQRAALAALRRGADDVKRMHGVFARRRQLMLDGLAGIDRVDVVPPEGAFYVFPDVSHYFGRQGEEGTIAGSQDLAEHLLETAHVATVPGSAFGREGHLRLSYAVSDDDITAGLARIEEALGALR